MPQPDLSAALVEEHGRDWLRAFCELCFAARDYSAARASGKPCPSASERLERAAVALYDVEAEWRPLVGRTKPELFLSRDDAEEVRLWRLYKHAMSYVPWMYPRREHRVPYERWHEIAILRGRKFTEAVLAMTWEEGAENA